jgi:hypothetical protein
MSQDFESFCAVDHGWPLGIAEVVQDMALTDGDLCSAKGAGIFRLLHRGTDDWDAGGMNGDGRVHQARVAKTT